MGHRKLAGKVSEQIIAGTPLLRIDVPELAAVNGEPPAPAFTQFYGPSSIYSLTPTTEEIARRFAAYRREAPVSPWELKALPAAARATDSDQEPEDD
jgi:hypothetical protein